MAGEAAGCRVPALPDFVGIGALKAGTSYLDAMLRSHPGLSLPRHVKEVEFFNRHHARGMDWYSGQFAAPDGRLRGEISPQYLDDASCPARIVEANPSAKLFVSVREPVARAYSQYRHWVQERGYSGDFAAFLTDHPGAVERGRYWAALRRYRDVFPADQIHVIVFEDMITRPLPVLQALYAFLGVDAGHVPEEIDQAVNVSGAARFPHLYVHSKKVSRWLYARGASRTAARLKRWGPGALLRGRETPPTLALGPPADVAARLADEFRGDAAQLSSYLGRDLVALWGLADP